MVKSDEEKIDLLTNILYSNHEILKMADTKSSFVMGISGIMLYSIVQVNKTGFPSYKIYLYSFAVLCLLISIISQLMTIYPRVGKNNYKSIFFYSDILKYQRKEYAKSITEIDSQKIIDDYIACIYDLAITQDIKFSWLNSGILFFIISIVAISYSFFL